MFKILKQLSALTLLLASTLSFAQKSIDELPSIVSFQDNWNGLFISSNSAQPWAPVTSEVITQTSWKWPVLYRVTKLDNGNYRFQNLWTDLYLTATSNNSWSDLSAANLVSQWTSMQWKLENVEGNKYRVKNAWTGFYLHSQSRSDQTILLAPLNTDWGSMIFTIDQ